jgi:hypothetical protein
VTEAERVLSSPGGSSKHNGTHYPDNKHELELADVSSDAFADFRDRLISLVGIKSAPSLGKRQ